MVMFIRPYHPVMAAHDFTGWQKIFMSFRIILSNTTSLSSFPYEDTRVQGSANAPRMPEMSAHLTWMIYLGQSRARAHHALQPRIMNNGVDAFTLNTLLAPLHKICRPMSSQKGRVNPMPIMHRHRAHIAI